tara:strand:+ start:35562 stop:41606 length:6045 start_codon:yes stop_codon:yes gene_type:complete
MADNQFRVTNTAGDATPGLPIRKYPTYKSYWKDDDNTGHSSDGQGREKNETLKRLQDGSILILKGTQGGQDSKWEHVRHNDETSGWIYPFNTDKPGSIPVIEPVTQEQSSESAIETQNENLQPWHEHVRPYTTRSLWVVAVQYLWSDEIFKAHVVDAAGGGSRIQLPSIYSDTNTMDQIRAKAVVDLFTHLGSEVPADDPPIDKIRIGDPAACALGAWDSSSCSWHVEPRGSASFIRIKVEIDKAWVDAHTRPIPTPVEEATKTLTLKGKELLANIKGVANILRAIKTQIDSSEYVVSGINLEEEAIEMEMAVSIINEHLVKNNIARPDNAEYKVLSETNYDDFQLGMRVEPATPPDPAALELLYFAHRSSLETSPTPISDIPARALNVGFEEFVGVGPFSRSRTLSLLFFSPVIMNEYRFLSADMSGPPEEIEWDQFFRKYVFPADNIRITNRTQADSQAGSADEALASRIIEGNAPEATDTIIAGPTERHLPQGLQNSLANSAALKREFTMDSMLERALAESETLTSVSEVYSKVLNVISMTDLTMAALEAIRYSLPLSDVEALVAKEEFLSLEISQIKNVIVPCLQSSAAPTPAQTYELGIALVAPPGPPDTSTEAPMDSLGPRLAKELMMLINSRDESLYALARRHAPDQFPKTPGQAPVTEEDLKAIERLYCTNLDFKNEFDSLYGSINDYKKAIENWYVSLTEVENKIVDRCVADNFGSKLDFLYDLDDVIDFYNSIPDVTEVFTLPALPMIPDITNFLKSVTDTFETSYKDIVKALFLLAVSTMLELIKRRLFGDINSDLANAPPDLNPFGFSSPVDMISRSPSNSATNSLSSAKLIKKCFDSNNVSYPSESIYLSFFNEVAAMFTVSEQRYIFKHRYANGGIFPPQKAAKYYKQILDFATTNKNYMDNIGAGLTLNKVSSLFKCIGNHIDDSIFQEEIDAYNNVKTEFLKICQDDECVNALTEQLNQVLSAEDASAQCAQNKNDNLNKITAMLPYLDANKIADMIPPLFCSPCDPPGSESIMPSQTHASQDYLNKQVNMQMYKSINSIFHIELKNYKPIMLGTKNAINSIMLGLSGDGTIMSETMKGIYTRGAEGATNPTSLGSWPDAASPTAVAQKLLSQIEQTIVDDNLESKSLAQDGSDVNFQRFSYSTEKHVFWLFFNFSNAIKKQPWSTANLKGEIFVPAHTLKTIIIDRAVGVIVNQNSSVNLFQAQDAFSDTLLSYAVNNYSTTLFGAILSGLQKSNIQAFYGQTLTDIFEKTLLYSTETGLFNPKNFVNLPLDDNSKTMQCGPEEAMAPLLQISNVANSVNKRANALECVIPRTASPTAQEVANLMGLYEVMLKVAVMEELLKNIFIFSIYDISDVIKSEAYEQFVYNKVLLRLSATDKFKQFKENALKIAQARRTMGEAVPDFTESEEAIRFLILEATQTISDILTTRVREFAMAPEKRQFYLDFQDINQYAGTVSKSAAYKEFQPRYLETIIYPHVLSTKRLEATTEDGNLVFKSILNQGISQITENFKGGFILQDYMEISPKFAGMDYKGNKEFKYHMESEAFRYNLEAVFGDLSTQYWDQAGISYSLEALETEIKTDPKYSLFSIAGGGPQPLAGPLNYWDGNSAPWRYRGKCDSLGNAAAWYRNKANVILSWINSQSDAADQVIASAAPDSQASAQAQLQKTFLDALRAIAVEAPYKNWFKPINYGMRLMLLIPRTEKNAFQYDNIANSLKVENIFKDTEEYTQLREDKILRYRDYPNPGDDYLALPVIDLKKEIVNIKDTNILETFDYLGSIEKWVSTDKNALKKELMSEIKEKLTPREPGAEDTALYPFFKQTVPVRDLIVLSALYQRVEIENLYPELNNLFNGALRKAETAISLQFSAMSRDYQARNNVLDGSRFSPEDIGMDVGAIAWTFFKLSTQAAASATDPSWRTPWLFPGPMTAVGVLAKVLGYTEGQGDGDDVSASDLIASDQCKEETVTSVDSAISSITDQVAAAAESIIQNAAAALEEENDQ